MFGTVNLDMRSLWINYEVALFVYDPGFATELRGLHKRTLTFPIVSIRHNGQLAPAKIVSWRTRCGWSPTAVMLLGWADERSEPTVRRKTPMYRSQRRQTATVQPEWIRMSLPRIVRSTKCFSISRRASLHMNSRIENNDAGLATPAKPSHTGRWIAIGLLLGVLCGVLFGEYCGALQVVGRAYVGLLQMTVLPYLVISLISKMGRLACASGAAIGDHRPWDAVGSLGDWRSS